MKLLRILPAAVALSLATGAPAQIKWLGNLHDFGAFDESFGPVSTEFRFVNEGPAPVTVVAARASCGCTSPKYPREAIEPGDTATIVVTYDPAGRPGRFTKYVAVDVTDNERTKLYIKGTVVGDAGSVQTRFPVDAGSGMQLQRGAVMFGRMEKNRTRSATLSLYNRSTDSIRPVVDGLPPYMTVMFEPAVVPPGDQATAIFYFNSSRCPEYGFVNDTVAIAANADAGKFALPTVAIVEEDFSKLTPKQLQKAPVATLSETSIDFGKVEQKGIVTRTITLRNEGRSPLIVRRLYSLDDGVSFSIDKTTIKPGKTAHITATVDTSKVPGSLINLRGSLITNAPGAPVQTIRLVGTF